MRPFWHFVQGADDRRWREIGETPRDYGRIVTWRQYVNPFRKLHARDFELDYSAELVLHGYYGVNNNTLASKGASCNVILALCFLIYL